MPFFADLHLHSRFSRATSRELTLPSLHAWAQKKGLRVVGTGDVTHPAWLEEIADQLEPAEDGLFRLRPELAAAADAGVPAACRGPVRFVLQGEVSSIYRHAGRVRKVHNLVFCPDLPAARRLLGTLDRLGNVRSDGRPILGLSSRDVLEVLLSSGDGCHLVPAHAWTPWFSILGSRSGYDSVEDCFEDLASHVFALETGLSSDPEMNWRVSALDRFALISNSDAHSPANLGREANEFDVPLSYAGLFGALRGGRGFLGTVEFFPEEGKYHLDGHRACGCRLEPAASRAAGGRCPACGGPLTIGVLHRIEELADRPPGVRPGAPRPFARLVPLPEVVAAALGVGPASRRVAEVYQRLLAHVGPELAVLRDAPLEEVSRAAGPVVTEALRRAREGHLAVEAGYDGEFGTVTIFRPEERAALAGQSGLFAVDPPLTGRRPRTSSGSPLRQSARGAGERTPEASPGDPATQGLDAAQCDAVLAPPGPLVIVAGPGSGKTRTLTRRIAHRILADGVPPDRVLAVTFTRRAADELRERLLELLGPEAAGAVTVGTLHSLGLHILREEFAAAGLPESFGVLGEEEALELLGRCTGLGAQETSRLREGLSRARRSANLPPELAPAADAYRQAVEARGAVDLDDLIDRPVALLEGDDTLRQRWQTRYAHVAVDEFQDLDALQCRLVSLLAPDGADVTVIGDPDQSIYGFRGADPAAMARFVAERPGVRRVALTRNYRSTPQIVAAARSALSNGAGPAYVEVPGAPGPLVQTLEAATEREEAALVAREVESLLGGTSSLTLGRSSRRGTPLGLGDVAVLYRLDAQRTALEGALGAAGIPFQSAGGEAALTRGKGGEVLRRLRHLPSEAPASESLRVALAEAGIPPDRALAAAWRAAAAASSTVGDLIDRVALRAPDDDWDRRAERIALLTLHAAKGLEFGAVFLTGCEEGVLPYLRPGEAGDVEEERRLFYVGMTRAREHLMLTRARSRFLYGSILHAAPSRFLLGLDPALLEARGPASARPRQLALL